MSEKRLRSHSEVTGIKLVGQPPPIDDPLTVIAGYAFTSRKMELSMSDRVVIGEDPSPERPRWGYRTYDCVAATEGSELVGADVLIAAGLNGDLTVDRVGAIQAAAPPVGEAIARIDEMLGERDAPTFWELDRTEIEQPGSEDGVGWWMHRAWSCLMRQKGVDVAITHKTLHHKRPLVFPLLDGKTIRCFDDRAAWAGIHDDLTKQRDAWKQLEAEFADLIDASRGEVALARLRMHDILLWLRAVGEDELAREAGADWLKKRR